ncbi:MAG: hypothetical protein V4732_13620 [Pseudomonadota bacterium]
MAQGIAETTGSANVSTSTAAATMGEKVGAGGGGLPSGGDSVAQCKKANGC